MLHKLPEPVNHDIGEGLNTAKNALHKAGLVQPTFRELENAFLVTIEHRPIASLEDTIIARGVGLSRAFSFQSRIPPGVSVPSGEEPAY